MLSDPEVMRFWPRPLSRSEAASWIERHRRHYLDYGHGYWLAIRSEDRQPVGQIGLLRQEFGGRLEVGLGYMLHRPFWGQGYALEGTKACLDYGFTELGMREIVVLIRPENEPSTRLVQKLDAVKSGQTDYAGFVHDVFTLRRNANR